MGSPTRRKLKQSLQQQILSNYYLAKYNRFMSKYTEKSEPSYLLCPKISQSNNMNSSRKGDTDTKRKNFKEAILEKKGVQVKNNYNTFTHPTSNQGHRNGGYMQLQSQTKQNKSSKDRQKERMSPNYFTDSRRKNFRTDLSAKNSLQKQKKQAMENFQKLQPTIINELYQPSPTSLQKSRKSEIQIIHHISYTQRQNSHENKSNRQKSRQNQRNIYVDHQQQSDDQMYEIQVQKLDLNNLSEAIRTTFERRSPRKDSKNKSVKSSKSAISKFPPKKQIKNQSYNNSNRSHQSHHSNNQSHNQSNNQSFEQEEQKPISFEESFFREKDRLNYHSVDERRRNIIKKAEEEEQILANRRGQQNFSLEEKRSNQSHHRTISEHSFEQIKNSNKNSLKSSLVHNSSDLQRQRKPLPHPQDSFHTSIPQIQQQLSTLLDPQHNNSRTHTQASDKGYSDNPAKTQRGRNNRSMNRSGGEGDSRMKQSSEFKQSVHELSMLSRFSMTSTEGGQIIEHLERQLNENQFGPYQNALTSLLDLLSQYPNAWPIFVVGQRILDDRRQYDVKRSLQLSEISKMQSKIASIKKQQAKLSQVERNSLKIMQLVRQLASTLESQDSY